jgi:hypothetical protein
MSMTYIRTRVTPYQIFRGALELAAVGFGLGVFVVLLSVVSI